MLGLQSDVLVAYQNWLRYDADYNLHLENKNIYQQFKSAVKAFTTIKDKYDVFHFNYGSSLIDFPKIGLSLLDLPFYNQNAKKIFTYNGSDIRQVHPMEYWPELENYKKTAYEETAIFMKKQRLKKVVKYADHIFSVNPDIMHFLPDSATFLPYAISNWKDLERVDKTIDKKITIVHSPTSRVYKGSEYILHALEKLQKKYKNVDVKIIENIPNKEAIAIYREADLVVDQVLIGWYGSFAVEVMKMGKPVAVFIREKDLRYIPENMKNDLKDAVINISPFDIEDKLSMYIENPVLLREKSDAGLDYVNRWHDPLFVAGIAKEVYEN